MMELHLEFLYEGSYDVVTEKPYPMRVGYVSGGNGKWCAEMGRETIGYYHSRFAALGAISDKVKSS